MSNPTVVTEANVLLAQTPANVLAGAPLEIPTILLNNWQPIAKELGKITNPGNPKSKLVALTNARYSLEKCSYGGKKQIINAWAGLTADAEKKILETINACAVPLGVNINTTKHDKARLIHLFSDPFHTALFTGAAQVKSRAELDDKEAPTDWWGQIAEAFNDYAGVPFTNPTVTLGPDGKPTVPQFAVPGMEIPFETCGSMDPCMGLDKRPLRNGAWVQKTLKDFKASWAPVWVKFKASGQQDAADPYDEFLKFNRGDDALLYAYVIWEGFDIEAVNNLLGKTLPDGIGRDTGIEDGSPRAQLREKKSTGAKAGKSLDA